MACYLEIGGKQELSGPVESGAIAQLVERLLCKQDVVGSNPSGSTTICHVLAQPERSSANACRPKPWRRGTGSVTHTHCWMLRSAFMAARTHAYDETVWSIMRVTSGRPGAGPGSVSWVPA